jgi:discoidin domain receptor family protein 2
VDFLYMPDNMIEEARNVTISLHGEHGRYVMVHLYFASKWILISEVTFWSGEE